ncbi:MAG: phosphoenolpyruvate carboxykinase (GTP), partial [Candidatus Competibacterales bacterium]|nr:phosphoenolpyruvate carboxykinase (GTP) [Candidatus Competibacterales bacterium]
SAKTNPNALAMLDHDAIFTNVALTENNEPWWEGKDDCTPALNWRGEPHDPDQGPAAHPNSRFTVSARQCPSYSEEAENSRGVPISAIIFGGRRAALAPLVFEARDWRHGVLVGASVASETTAAATGKVGHVRRDPMAMKPFCGYNFADYWDHWLSFADKSDRLPRVFHVNWFRKNDEGRFIWPGFGENLRVLEWILDRCAGRAEAVESPVGRLPRPQDIDSQGLDLAPGTLESLLAIDADHWLEELSEIRGYLNEFGDRVPSALWEEYDRTLGALRRSRHSTAAD